MDVRRAPAVRLHREQRRQLAALARDRRVPSKVALRAEIALRAADGQSNVEIARALGLGAHTVGVWRKRFLFHGVAGLTRDAPRPGRPPVIPASKVQAVLEATQYRKPPRGPRWTVRALALETGLSRSTVQRIWRAHGLAGSRRPIPRTSVSGLAFLERVTDLVGLYLNPSERAVAFSTDERVPVAAPSPRVRRSPTARRRRPRGAEFRAFLQRADRETPGQLDVHLLVDSRLGPAPPEVDRWLRTHPRFHLHYLPTDPGSLNLIDRLIDGFSRRRDRPGTSASAHRLKYAIQEHLASYRSSLRSFIWTATSDEIRGAYGRMTIP